MQPLQEHQHETRNKGERQSDLTNPMKYSHESAKLQKCTYHCFDGLGHVGELEFRELRRHREMHDFLLVLGGFVED